MVDSVKQTAHDTSVKAKELEKSAEHKLEQTKEWLSEKGSEAAAKGNEILDATQQAIVTGAAAVTEKVKQGVELASEAASNVKTSTEQFATDVKTKASAAADVVATKTVEAKDATVAAAQTAAATVQGKILILIRIFTNSI